jgi:hypothetical protein
MANIRGKDTEQAVLPLVLQMEALQQQWENTTKQMEGVNADTRKMKRSVTRIQNAQEVGASSRPIIWVAACPRSLCTTMHPAASL